MKLMIRLCIFQIQKILLYVSYVFFSFFVKKIDNVWVIGVDEVAATIWNLSHVLEPSISVSLSWHPFYSYKYDYSLFSTSKLGKLRRLIYSPILLGLLLNKSDRFLYIWDTGFLMNSVDGRKFEFSFLKRKGKELCCLFCGNDIRSPYLARKNAERMGIEVTATYYDLIAPHRLTEKYENHKKLIAASADEYADVIFNAPIDQISYLKKQTCPPIYAYPDELFIRRDAKFQEISSIKILHAPSSPIVKGTQIVRAAIKKLRIEGYTFVYTELLNVPNQRVIEELRDAHIVLNEFYAFVPGQFGIEAMAAHCALVTSGDPTIETSLPVGSAGAWMITKYWQVYDHLKYLLDHPDQIKKYADSGFEWAKENCRYSIIKDKLTYVLK